MSVDSTLDEFRKLLETLGLYLSNQQFALLILVLIAASLGVFSLVFRGVTWILRWIWRGGKAFLELLSYDEQTKNFIKVRKRFAEHLITEVERLNREADWNDFYYTHLEAEVEVDTMTDFDYSKGNITINFLRSLPFFFREILNPAGRGKTKNSLVEAIINSKSRAFLVIGDPGSGKTVSLRHLFLRLAKKCTTSRNKSAVLPLYLNLKGLDVSADVVTADVIHEWVLRQLLIGQDRLIYEFLNKYFDTMLTEGLFFFLFDSFDEIPAVMDAQEDTEVVRQFADALNRFLHAPHGCRGLVCSRPYRAPKVFIGQRCLAEKFNIRLPEKLLKPGSGCILAELWRTKKK